ISAGRLRSVPEAMIDHLSGTAGLSFRVGRRYPARRVFLTAKNRVLFVLRTLRGRTITLLLPILVLHELAQAAFAASRGWADAYFGGLLWNAGHLGRTLRKRERIQGRRNAKDREILQEGRLPLHPGTVPKSGALELARRALEAAIFALYRPV